MLVLYIILAFIAGIWFNYYIEQYEYRWRSLDDEEPERWQQCLLSVDDKTVKQIFMWDGKYFRIGITDYKYREDIDGWRPLPPPPSFKLLSGKGLFNRVKRWI